MSLIRLNNGSEKAQTVNQEHNLGDIAYTQDGRWFRYCFSDGAVTAGKLVQQVANIAAHDNDLVTAAAAVGATTITVTLGATAIVKDEYKDGLHYVNDGPGEGQMFTIGAHPAVAASGSFAVPIVDEDGVRTALTATSECGLMKNPWKDVIIAPTTPTGAIAGRTCVDVSDNRYFWAQRTGLAAILIDGVVVIGQQVMRSDGVAGAVEAVDFAGTVEPELIGAVTLLAVADTEYGLIMMAMAP